MKTRCPLPPLDTRFDVLGGKQQSAMRARDRCRHVRAATAKAEVRRLADTEHPADGTKWNK
ncbi:MAG: hypothetical protein PHU85_20310, partial [Phycisphaerae bacterium]|nr:hypothetical protein [Phycisphaerae bacterium]